MKVRTATERDASAIADVFTRSVHGIAASSYSVEQRAVWAPVPPDVDRWRARITSLTTLVADFDEEIGGFLGFGGSP